MTGAECRLERRVLQFDDPDVPDAAESAGGRLGRLGGGASAERASGCGPGHYRCRDQARRAERREQDLPAMAAEEEETTVR